MFSSRPRSQRSAEPHAPDGVAVGGVLGVQRRRAVQLAAAARVRHVRAADRLDGGLLDRQSGNR